MFSHSQPEAGWDCIGFFCLTFFLIHIIQHFSGQSMLLLLHNVKQRKGTAGSLQLSLSVSVCVSPLFLSLCSMCLTSSLYSLSLSLSLSLFLCPLSFSHCPSPSMPPPFQEEHERFQGSGYLTRRTYVSWGQKNRTHTYNYLTWRKYKWQTSSI